MVGRELQPHRVGEVRRSNGVGYIPPRKEATVCKAGDVHEGGMKLEACVQFCAATIVSSFMGSGWSIVMRQLLKAACVRGICTERTTFLGKTDRSSGVSVARRYFAVRDTLSTSTSISLVQSAKL